MKRREFVQSLGVFAAAYGIPMEDIESAMEEPSKLQQRALGTRAHVPELDVSFIYVRNLTTGMFEWACISEAPVKLKMK